MKRLFMIFAAVLALILRVKWERERLARYLSAPKASWSASTPAREPAAE